jgi:RNA polymerase sigma factor (sigma-70 family)
VTDRRGSRHSRSPTDKLVTENLRLVLFVAKDFVGRGIDFDELVAAGNEGLVKAARTFDPARAELSTWLVYKIRSEMQELCRSEARHWTRVDDDADAPELKGVGMYMSAVANTPPPVDGIHRDQIHVWKSWGERGNASASYEHWTTLDATAEELRQQIAEAGVDADDLRGLQRRLLAWMEQGCLQQAAREEGISYWRATRLLKKSIKKDS